LEIIPPTTKEQTLNQLTLTVRARDVYGVRTFYPADDTAHTFARIAGTKTLTRDTIDQIKKLGYTIEQAREEFII
jgi:DNA-directed RNA polymerase sigma subunit (sigma70/sigma32)